MKPRQIIPLKHHTATKRDKRDSNKTKTNHTIQNTSQDQNETKKTMMKPRPLSKHHTETKHEKEDNDETKTNNTTLKTTLQQNETNETRMKPRQIIPINTRHFNKTRQTKQE